MNLLLTLFLSAYYGVPFLTLYPGARQTGMGGAFCAVADDAYATLYNPSGLAFQKSLDVGFEYNSIPWFETTRNWNFVSVIPIYQNLSLGLFSSGVYSKWEDIFENYSTIEDFTFGLSVGHSFFDFLGVGINLKYINSSYYYTGYPHGPIIYRITGRSFAADIGILAEYHFSYGNLSVGLAAQNIGPKVSYYSGYEETLPLYFRGGFSYIFTAKEISKQEHEGWLKERLKETWRVIIAYDANKVKDEMVSHSFGLELCPIPILVFRLGYFLAPASLEENRREGWTKGLGIDLKYFRIDISNDDPFFYLKQNRLRYSFSVNIGEPIFPKNGLLGR